MTRSILITVLSLFLLIDAAAGQTTKRESQTVALDERGRVEISSYRGTIHVDTWSRAEARLEVIVESDDADLVEATDILIDSSPKRLEISTEVESRGGLFSLFSNNGTTHPDVHIRLTMPATAALRIHDYRSAIRLSGLEEGVAVETYRGSIEGKDIGGEILIETYRGEVRLAGVRGGVNLDTYRGDAQIHFAALTGGIQIETYRGDVRLDLPANARFSIDADPSRRGRITSDFELASTDGRIRTDVNGGGPLIHYRTYRGDLSLNAL